MIVWVFVQDVSENTLRGDASRLHDVLRLARHGSIWHDSLLCTNSLQIVFS